MIENYLRDNNISRKPKQHILNLHRSHVDQFGNNFQADICYNNYNHIQYKAVFCWYSDNFPR